MRARRIALVIALLLGTTGCGYNSLVQHQEAIRSQWAQVETVLQRRYDLIPNLVNTVKGYAQHEKSTLEEVTRLRSQWGQASTINDKVQAANQLESALSRLLVVSEQYPELKANQGFLDLQAELAGTENRIAVERRRYNDAVREYNVLVRSFPTNLTAKFTGFKPSDAYFQSDTEAKKAPVVQF